MEKKRFVDRAGGPAKPTHQCARYSGGVVVAYVGYAGLVLQEWGDMKLSCSRMRYCGPDRFLEIDFYPFRSHGRKSGPIARTEEEAVRPVDVINEELYRLKDSLTAATRDRILY